MQLATIVGDNRRIVPALIHGYTPSPTTYLMLDIVRYAKCLKSSWNVFATVIRKYLFLQVRSVFVALECILLRIADDLNKHKNVGKFVSHQILTAHLSSVYYVFSLGNKSAQIKSGLRLLTAMVLQGKETATEILLLFNFTHAHVTPLLTRIDTMVS